MKDANNRKLLLYGLLFLALMLLLTALVLPYIRILAQPEYQDEIQSWVKASGFWGLAAVFLLQVAQVIAAFVPGEPVELLAGVLYGVLGGLALCLAGCVCATCLVFALARRYGKKVTDLLFSPEKLSRWQWMQDREKSDLVIFLLFFLPGTPKDMLTYIVPLTRMKLSEFLTISLIARFPSVISSIIGGDFFGNGKYLEGIILFLATGAVSVTGMLIYRLILKKRQHKKEK